MGPISAQSHCQANGVVFGGKVNSPCMIVTLFVTTPLGVIEDLLKRRELADPQLMCLRKPDDRENRPTLLKILRCIQQ